MKKFVEGVKPGVGGRRFEVSALVCNDFALWQSSQHSVILTFRVAPLQWTEAHTRSFVSTFASVVGLAVSDDRGFALAKRRALQRSGVSSSS